MQWSELIHSLGVTMALVVLLDDDPLVRDMTTDMLLSAGHEVRAFSLASKAMEYMSSGPTDALVTDIRLGGPIDGWAVAASARQRASRLPILYITGYFDSRERDRMVPDARLLRKPFSLDDLVAEIDALLGGE